MLVEADTRKWWILGAMGGVMGIILLDETVIGVALPTIQKDLGLSQVASHWVINAYLLVFAGCAAVGGKLGDLFGEVPSFLVGVCLFAVSSIACGFAPSGDWLIAARIVQGFGAAIVFPISLAIVTAAFPPEQRGTAFGIYGATGTFFLALGPFVGGSITEILSWRWIFWINPPIIAVIVWILLTATERPIRKGTPTKIDYPGALLLIAGLGMVVFAIMQGPDWGWSNPAVAGVLAGGIAALVAFTVLESRTADPLIDVALFRGSGFTVSNFVIFMAQFNQMTIVVFGAMYLQLELGMSPIVTGAALLAAVGAAPITATPTGKLIDRFGPRPIALAGLAIMAVAMLWIGLSIDDKSYLLLLPAFIGWGTANAALFAAPRRAVMNTVPEAQHGQSGGILMTAQLLGGTIGVAVGGTLYATTKDFRFVFLATALLTFCAFALTWLYLERPGHSSPAPRDG